GETEREDRSVDVPLGTNRDPHIKGESGYVKVGQAKRLFGARRNVSILVSSGGLGKSEETHGVERSERRIPSSVPRLLVGHP
ncbi:MAG: hypothetical protein V3U33_03585, partial [candidate division NC10 bacterium]